MKLNLLNALIATAVLFVMASFLMGMQLSRTAPSWWCTARRKYAGCGSASVASSSFLPAVAPAAAEKLRPGALAWHHAAAALVCSIIVAGRVWASAQRWS